MRPEGGLGGFRIATGFTPRRLAGQVRHHVIEGGQLGDNLRRNRDPESLLDARRQFRAEGRIQPQVVHKVGVCLQGFLGNSQGFADQNLGLVIELVEHGAFSID